MFESIVGLDIDGEKQIAGLATLGPFGSFASDANGLTVLDPGGETHLDPFLGHGSTRALTGSAFVFKPISSTPAGNTGEVDGSDLGRTRTGTGRATVFACAAGVAAIRAPRGATDGHHLFFGRQKIFQCAREWLFDVCASLWRPSSRRCFSSSSRLVPGMEQKEKEKDNLKDEHGLKALSPSC